jgi:hypothetical protein
MNSLRSPLTRFSCQPSFASLTELVSRKEVRPNIQGASPATGTLRSNPLTGRLEGRPIALGQGNGREVIIRVDRLMTARRPGRQQPAVGEEGVLGDREVERAAAPGARQLHIESAETGVAVLQPQAPDPPQGVGIPADFVLVALALRRAEGGMALEIIGTRGAATAIAKPKPRWDLHGRAGAGWHR